MEIKIKTDGYVFCKSSFFSVHDVVQEKEYRFSDGINKLVGEIDSGNFGISYLISMYDKIDKALLFPPQNVTVDGKEISFSELSKISCYIDESYPLFSDKRLLLRKKTVKQHIECGLKKSKLPYTAKEILDMFMVQEHHREVFISHTGTERYKVMPAIGFAYGKEIFCFPWFSKSRYQGLSLPRAYAYSRIKLCCKTFKVRCRYLRNSQPQPR